jgi:hypothetical protein
VGTNYFVTGPGVEPSDGDPGLHIGKKSFGWEFLFRGHPELGLTTVAQWRAYVAEPGRRIVSEYHQVWGTDEFFAMATRRARPGLLNNREYRSHSGGHIRKDADAGGVAFDDREFC